MISVVSNMGFWFTTSLWIIKQFSDQVKISLTSQLIKGISRFHQRFLKYFNGTVTSILSILPLSPVWPVIFYLKLNESVALAPLNSTILQLLFTAGISLQYCHKLPDVFE